MTQRLSQDKARAVATRCPGALVLACDTVVALGDTIMGKPQDAPEAVSMLRQLRGRRHQVLTAVTALNTVDRSECTTCSITDVWMRSYTDEDIAAYVATGDPLDKAGAYAIQHAGFDPVAQFHGCYSGVMGFPLAHVVEALQAHGVTVPIAAHVACDGWRGQCCALGRKGPIDA
jgi:septum formation protein